mgnify:CR=1 FL=1
MTQDTGIQSTAEERKFLHGMFVSVSAYAGNQLEGHIGQTQHVGVYDYAVRSHAASGTNQYPATNPINYIAIGRELAVGEVFKAGLECGGTNTNLFGSYEWEPVDEVGR